MKLEVSGRLIELTAYSNNIIRIRCGATENSARKKV